MAARTATKTGVWSDVTVWDGGASLPGSGDTADSNGYTVTIDQDIDLSPAGALIGTAAGAGGFSCATARTITANITASVRTVLTVSHTSGTVTINGNITGGSATSVRTITSSTAGTVTINGNITGGSASNAVGVYKVSSGTVNVVGTIRGGSASAAHAVEGGNVVVLNVTGDVMSGSSNAHGVSWGSTGTLTVIGNVSSVSNDSGRGIYVAAACTVNVTGNVVGSGSGVGTVYGIHCAGAATITVSGTTTGSQGSGHGIVASAGSVTVPTAIGGSNGAAGLACSGSAVGYFGAASCGADGSLGLSGRCKLIVSPATNYIRLLGNDAALHDLSDDYPSVADVEAGVVYKLGTLTGELAGGGGAVSISPALSGGIS